MRKTVWILASLLAGIALVAAGCGSGNDEEGAGGGPVTVQLSPQSGSGESGTATLTADGDKTRVEVQLDGAPAAAQPAHIHEGTCQKLNPKPEYPLDDVTNGSSTTEVNVSLDDLKSEAYAINVHKSATDLTTYVACGNFGKAGEGGEDSGGGGY